MELMYLWGERKECGTDGIFCRRSRVFYSEYHMHQSEVEILLEPLVKVMVVQHWDTTC